MYSQPYKLHGVVSVRVFHNNNKKIFLLNGHNRLILKANLHLVLP